MKLIKPKSPKQLDKHNISRIGMFLYYTGSFRFFSNADGCNADAQPNWWNPICLVVIGLVICGLPIVAMITSESLKEMWSDMSRSVFSKVDQNYYPHII